MQKSTSETLIQGLTAGLIGYGTVVVLYGVVNMAAGQAPWETAARLGAELLGPSRIGQPGAEFGPVVAFNGVHLLVSLAAGMAASWLFFETELHPRQYYAVLAALSVGLVGVTVVLGVLGASVAGAVSWGSVTLAVLAAAGTMGGYLWWAHPRLRAELAELDE